MYNTLKEIYVEIMQEVYSKFGVKVDIDSIEFVIEDYFKSIRKFMMKGKARDDNKVIENFTIPYLGTIKFNRKRMQRINLKNPEPTFEERRQRIDDYKYIASYGWHYLTWVKNKGFLFINGIDKTTYSVDEGITNEIEAISRFREIVETNTDIKWNKNPEFIPAVPITGEVYKRGINGYYLGSYDSVSEAANNEFLDSLDLMESLIHNERVASTKYGKHMKVGGYFWFKANGDKEKMTIRTVREPHKVLFSALDKDTGKVVYEDIGNSSETIWFLKKLLGKKKRLMTSVLFRAVKRDIVAYGFKWKFRPC